MKIAISPCPNDTFAFGHLHQKRVAWSGDPLSWRFLDIEALNTLALSVDAPEVIKFSYAIWPKLKKTHRLLPVGSAMGFGVGPLLVGQGRDFKRVLVPGWNTTATVLAKRFLPDAELMPCRYDEILGRLAENPEEAGVIIHESRFTFAQHGLKLLVDLGGAWEEQTQLPLPLGGIAIRRDVPDPLARVFTQALRDSLDAAWDDGDSIRPFMAEHAQEMDDEVMQGHVELYVNEFTKRIGAAGLRAIETLTGSEVDQDLWD